MTYQWHYLSNQFLNVTVANWRKMLKLSNYHDAYLNKMKNQHPTDPDFETLYNTYHAQKGKTLSLSQVLDLLVTQVNNWDRTVQGISGFEKGTGNYMTFFPQGHLPFYRGPASLRSAAVKVLSDAKAAFPDDAGIVALKTWVDAFAIQLNAAIDTQESAKGGTKQQSEQLEIQRIATAKALYHDLGLLMAKYVDNPNQAAAFFDISLLRSHEQVLFTGTLAPGESEAVFIHTFEEDEEMSLEVTNANPMAPPTQATFYLASLAKGKNSTPITITANEAKTKIPASAFGISEYSIHRYLTVDNSTAFELHYILELL